ncbi:MAG: ABC transporter permease, partial [Armatimonadota bacterium]
PLVLAAMAGFTSERGGIVNIGLEGKIVVSTFFAAMVGGASHNPWLGLVAALVSAVTLAWLHWGLTQAFNVDHIVSGMALNALGLGTASFMDRKFKVSEGGNSLAVVPVWILITLAIVLPLALAAAMKWTKWGLRLKAVGADPAKARQMGVNPLWVRAGGLTLTGVFCGLAGVLLLSHTGFYTDGMVAGRGYIALAALILGGWKPLPTLGACVVFGLSLAVEIQFQGTPLFGVTIPRELWYSLPYIVTVVALAGFLGGSKPPAGLGKA